MSRSSFNIATFLTNWRLYVYIYSEFWIPVDSNLLFHALKHYKGEIQFQLVRWTRLLDSLLL